MSHTTRLASLTLLGLLACACQQDNTRVFDNLPVSETVPAGVDQPVEIVRDEYGVPHLYGQSLLDVSWAQGYVMAQDRMLQMDLLRHLAGGTLAELFGEALIDQDIGMRVHHMRATAEQVWQELRGSGDAADQKLVAVLTRFAAGVNAYLAELSSGRRDLSAVLALAFDVKNAAPWSPVDSLLLGRLQAFDLSYDADSELIRTQAEAAAFQVFDQTNDPILRTRRGLASDLFQQSPLAPAFILPDATGCAPTMPRQMTPQMAQPAPRREAPATRLYDFGGLKKAVAAQGLDRALHPSRGSNNWIVAPRNTQNGHALLANDTHLNLTNPAVFYLSHLSVSGQVNLMGVQFPGLPGEVLGMNDHLAWGATVTNADVTDLYEEQIMSCAGKPCVLFRDPAQTGSGQKMVLLQPRVEEIRVGHLGRIDQKRSVTLYDVPHHGPLLPHIKDHDVLPPSAVEISVRYTGYRPTQETRALLNVDQAATVADGMAAIERDFQVGGENWVFADSQGHIGWTTHEDLPIRPPGTRPYLVLPGDGSAEWLPEGVPAAEQPRALDPACGLLVTANNDPLGATSATRKPDGKPLIYHGWDYDVGARAERITTRLRQGAQGPGRLNLMQMQDIQADHTSFLGTLLLPVLRDAGEKLLQERQTPGKYPDLSAVAMTVDGPMQQRLSAALARLIAWQLSTPSGLDNESSPAEVAESIATTLFNVWLADFHVRTLGDEFQAIEDAMKARGVDVPRPGSDFQRKLLCAAALTPERLLVGRQDNGDSLLFDDLRTTDRIETRREIAARSLLAALVLLGKQLGDDMGKWQWGRPHRLTLDPLLPIDSLKVPTPGDANFPDGVPRHGDLYAVDAAHYGLTYGAPDLASDYTYGEGPAIRFVVEMAPEGPRAFNVLPGGEVFSPDSPHYADQFALWRKNQAFALPFTPDAVAASAAKEAAQQRPARVRLVPN